MWNKAATHYEIAPGVYHDADWVSSFCALRIANSLNQPVHTYDRPIEPNSRNIDPYLKRRLWK